MASAQTCIQKLIDVAKSASNGSEIRVGAIEGLGYAGGAKAREALKDILSHTPNGASIRAAAATALGRASSVE